MVTKSLCCATKIDSHPKRWETVLQSQILCKASLLIKGEANASGIWHWAPHCTQRHCDIVGKPWKSLLPHEYNATPICQEARCWMVLWKPEHYCYVNRNLYGTWACGKVPAHLFFNRAFFFEPVIQDFIFECASVAHRTLLDFGNGGSVFHNLYHS